MSNSISFNQSDAHRFFAVEANKEAWQLLEQTQRSEEDNDRLLRAAHTSLYHWLAVGDGVHFQRGYWLLSHSYALLKQTTAADYYADKCLTHTKLAKIEVFDRAYCYEALSRVAQLKGNEDDAHAYKQLALDIADEISNEKDKTIFMSDINRQ